MAALLYGPNGQEVVLADGRGMDDILARHALVDGDDPVEALERVVSLLAVAIMLARTLADAGVELPDNADVLRSAMGAAINRADTLGPAWRCAGCGCTALTPCERDEERCSWAGPLQCSFCAGGVH